MDYKEWRLRDTLRRRAPSKTSSIKPLPKRRHSLGFRRWRVERRLGRGYRKEPLTRAFMEQLFGSLREDFATLKREIAAEIKDLKREVVDLGQRVDTIEQMHDAREKELHCHRRELLTLQDKNQELQYQIEDLENRSRHSDIRLKGAPVQAVKGALEYFVVRLSCHVAPALKEQNIVLDRMHRAGYPARMLGQAQDILTCLHYYKQ
ncbi:hypothetical protein NDU88_003448 [Pleurodeles waltl]|uniref:Uncharacterized protein n=1 Tax=Pleurodeles waltl TaxID=8319 RepID=A0AAV7T6H1_PLEWA|nr:hypothetical protein NDU88_003448 [Pleurodeles waltl]